MARGNPPERYNSRHSRTQFYHSLDRPIWSTINDHDRSRTTVGIHLFRALTDLLCTTRIRTTSYHPASNGLVERLHRQLKAAIKMHNNLRWTEVLPLVLLGIRTAIKADLGCSAAELVYGTGITLPAQFVTPTKPETDIDPANYVHRLKRLMQQACPTPTRKQQATSYNPPDLPSSSHVFVRQDAVRKPLQPPYRGPFPVLHRTSKFFTIDINGKRENVSVDRLKPAFMESDCAIPPTVTDPTPIVDPPPPIITTHGTCITHLYSRGNLARAS